MLPSEFSNIKIVHKKYFICRIMHDYRINSSLQILMNWNFWIKGFHTENILFSHKRSRASFHVLYSFFWMLFFSWLSININIVLFYMYVCKYFISFVPLKSFVYKQQIECRKDFVVQFEFFDLFFLLNKI